MKCIVLAGGSGDRLWPLSRKNYPKQFMEIKKGRSMFQEAILRNMPFCDEFVVITNKKYENIARGQLQSFQSINYTILLEDKPLNTAPSIITVALYAQPEEELLIVSCDHIIEGEYNPTLTKLIKIVKDNKIGAVGVKPSDNEIGYHFFDVAGKRTRFSPRKTKNCYFDCGIYAAKASVILQTSDQEYIERCRNIGLKDGVFEEFDEGLVLGLDKLLNPDYIELVEAHFNWTRITDISSYYQYIGRSSEVENDINAIEFDNRNVEIINTSKEQLIVANGLRDILIANTRDAIYITQIDKEGNIKDIVKKNYQYKSKYFDERLLSYEKWGSVEILNRNEKCEVSRIVVYPNRGYSGIVEDGCVVNYYVTEGSAKIYNDTHGGRSVSRNGSVLFRSGNEYEISNETKNDLVMIQTKNLEFAEIEKKKIKPVGHESLVKLKPVLKDFLWGGTKIRDILKKPVGNMSTVAESWELSAHPAGQSTITTGKYKGLPFSDYLKMIGKEQLGWKTQSYERFPLMVKFIDAKQSLSIQVHPNDEYAFSVEGDYGKNEMWYIMEADKDACIYVGFNKDVTVEEVRERVKKGTIMEVLNKVPVKKGEAYFLRSGTVHAIGGGCFVCEVQQSSNVTYRLYDYGRKDKNGKTRELHIDRALDVLDLRKSTNNLSTEYPERKFDGYSSKLIGECKYFSVNKYEVNGTLKLASNDTTFQVIIIIDGKCKIGNGSLTYPSKMGDTWFSGSWDTVEISGKCTALVVNI